MKRDHKAIALFSGGLDSMLAVLFMQKLGYEVVPIFFESPFYPANKARHGAKVAGIDIEVVDITADLIEVLKKPRYGFGKHMNPCIDCHGLMFRKASEMMEKYQADFLISGEVLGQRPMSQRHDSMNAVAKLSGVKDLLIRPLCQKLIKDTKPITEGWVKKEEMLDIQGRGRYRQLELAEKYGLKNFDMPGGGCLLTDKNVSKKVADLIQHDQLTPFYLKYLQAGRRIRLADNVIMIVTRTSFESDYLTPLLQDEIVIKAADIAGPLGVLMGENITDQQIKLAGRVILTYNNKLKQKENTIEYGRKFHLDNKLLLTPLPRNDLDNMLINK